MVVKDKRALVEDPQLQAALRELLLANEGFRHAYELWERAPDPEVSWERRLLEEAQARLDTARERVSEVESHLRHEGGRTSDPR